MAVVPACARVRGVLVTCVCPVPGDRDADCAMRSPGQSPCLETRRVSPPTSFSLQTLYFVHAPYDREGCGDEKRGVLEHKELPGAVDAVCSEPGGEGDGRVLRATGWDSDRSGWPQLAASRPRAQMWVSDEIHGWSSSSLGHLHPAREALGFPKWRSRKFVSCAKEVTLESTRGWGLVARKTA